MKFVEVAEGFSVRVDSIVSIRKNPDGSTTIESEDREYTILADYSLLMQYLEEEDIRKQKMQNLTSQFFGG